MKRPLRYRTMGAVREGRGNPSPYSILCLARSGNGRKRQAPFEHGIKAGIMVWRCHD